MMGNEGVAPDARECGFKALAVLATHILLMSVYEYDYHHSKSTTHTQHHLHQVRRRLGPDVHFLCVFVSVNSFHQRGSRAFTASVS